MQHYNGFVKPLQVRIHAPSPGVAVRLLLDNARFFGERDGVAVLFVHLRHAGGKREIRPRVKRRVNVNQVDLPGELRQQRRQHVFLVAPHEPVPPRLFLVRQLEQVALAVLRRFVDRLDSLKRQRHSERSDAVALGVVLAVPDQFGFRGHG
jgi:hypothetical protein